MATEGLTIVVTEVVGEDYDGIPETVKQAEPTYDYQCGNGAERIKGQFSYPNTMTDQEVKDDVEQDLKDTGMIPYTKGTATSAQTNKLIDSAATFQTDGVLVDDFVCVNGSKCEVVLVDSETQLTLDVDGFPLGTEDYHIYRNLL